jgi:hypothetical protein
MMKALIQQAFAFPSTTEALIQQAFAVPSMMKALIGHKYGK